MRWAFSLCWQVRSCFMRWFTTRVSSCDSCWNPFSAVNCVCENVHIMHHAFHTFKTNAANYHKRSFRLYTHNFICPYVFFIYNSIPSWRHFLESWVYNVNGKLYWCWLYWTYRLFVFNEVNLLHTLGLPQTNKLPMLDVFLNCSLVCFSYLVFCLFRSPNFSLSRG